MTSTPTATAAPPTAVFDARQAAVLLYGSTPSKRFKRWKFRLRSLWFWRVQRAWHAMLATPALLPFVQQVPSLLEKLHRPYLHRHKSVRQRLDVLCAHYSWLAAPHRQALRGALLREPMASAIVLAHWQLEDEDLKLVLGIDPVFNREGELVISLLNRDQRRIGSIALVRGENDTFWIGSLQGLIGDDARDRYRELTRALHGLRPKNLLLIAAQTLARASGAKALIGIGNDAHVYSATRYRNLQRVQADYDEFWRECEGSARDDGSFGLPMRYVIPPREELPTKKRAMYERRRALLVELQSQMTATLSSLGLSEPLDSDGQESTR